MSRAGIILNKFIQRLISDFLLISECASLVCKRIPYVACQTTKSRAKQDDKVYIENDNFNDLTETCHGSNSGNLKYLSRRLSTEGALTKLIRHSKKNSLTSRQFVTSRHFRSATAFT